MSLAARLNSRFSQLAVGRHLPNRTVRIRLTFLYGGLFLISGAALMAITYALLVNAGFVFTLQNGAGTTSVTGQPSSAYGIPSVGFPAAGARTHPSAQAISYWRQVAQCMRQHGISRFPQPRTSVPSNFRRVEERNARNQALGVVSDRDGAILVFPNTINMQSAVFTQAASACGYIDDSSQQAAQQNQQRAQTRQQLLVQSGIALAGMSLLSLGLGWLMAGRVLQPLEDTYRAQRQFVANASHELRAPLTRMRALSEVALASPEANAASLRRAHERVLASEQHLEQLIDALLALTRGQAGLERREHLDLTTLASNAILANQSALASLNLDLHATLRTAPTVGDPRLLERLITNLLDNAIRHNSGGGHLNIATGTRDRRAFLTITNTGPIVPPEQIERLFQPFQRLDGARTHHNNGYGLGLSIVKAITAAHNAVLVARSGSQGGLTIEVSFPPAIRGTMTSPLPERHTPAGAPAE